MRTGPGSFGLTAQDIADANANAQNTAIAEQESPWVFLWFVLGAGGAGAYWYYYLRKGRR